MESYQNAPSALCPAGKMAPLSFIDNPITLLLKLVAILSSSPMVVVQRFAGLILPAGLFSIPTEFTVLSSTQYTDFCVKLSNQLFPEIPFKAGTEPV